MFHQSNSVIPPQVLKDDGTDINTFLNHLSDTQANSFTNLEQALALIDRPPRITRIRYLDTEPRGVCGLKILGDELLREDAMAESSS